MAEAWPIAVSGGKKRKMYFQKFGVINSVECCERRREKHILDLGTWNARKC